MPPKPSSKPANKESKKTELKKKEKIVEDKTFGLKNKKGSKQQKFIQQVQHQVKNSGLNKTQKQLEKEKEDAKKEKEKKKLELEQLNAILKPVQQLGKGVDPKSVVCAFFKQGTCTKGAKCKFSHDLAVEKKPQDRKKAEKGDEMSIEELVERERAALGVNTTKVTEETFLAWYKKKAKERAAAMKKATDKKKSDLKSGRDVRVSGGECGGEGRRHEEGYG
ncbi:zinc finger CCCH domain-containing protein 15 [Hyalella azteca]|uniref:Zinc finger CCCH domain-containing protein 15 n=1 Tax=Hyalella azteca TaxID=294128 RepID=A0A8B7N5H5_HYAAZ|nr:zinc finger CCCH domain-containing protein 15 [Hyalella azteca]